MRKTLIIAVLVVVVATGIWWWGNRDVVAVTSFEECVEAGNPVMESYPRQCRHGETTFTEFVGNELEKTDLIRIETPRPNQTISSPLVIRGEARGNWFFEASFPVTLVNWDGLIIAESFATAQDEWMTTDFVPFEAKIEFETDPNTWSNRGYLILRKDNPSGLPEHDDALEIPVLFEKVEQTRNSGVSGLVLLGPTCPVMREGDDSCADRPYQTTVQVFAKDNQNSPLRVVETDKDGRYKFSLPPGEYTLRAVGGAPFPGCSSTDIIVESNKMLETNLSCDTGIR